MAAEPFAHVRQLILESTRSGRAKQLEGADGLSGDALIGTLQRLAVHQAQVNHGSYLEIGVFRGLTLLSVASSSPQVVAYGIDNFSQFDPKGQNKRTVLGLKERHGLQNAHLIDDDFESALESLPSLGTDQPIGLYFIDGPHDYRSQLMCLELARPHLSPHAIVVVDDSNYEHVRWANRDFLRTNPDFKLLFEAYTPCHPSNMTSNQLSEARKGWWNGVNVLVRDPDDELALALPPVSGDRSLFFNDHIVHALRRADIAPHATEFLVSLLSLRLLRAGKALGRSVKRMLRGRASAALPNLNTNSQDLPAERWCGSER